MPNPLKRLDELGRISDEPGRLTRTFCSPAMRRANELVASWMREAGMTVRQDAIGNLIGHYGGAAPDSKILLLGSHLDTVRDAGKFDGPLGVLVAIACIEHLQRTKISLPFAIEVAGFCDEEGARYQTTYLGSKVLAGTFDSKDLERKDAAGISMAEAIRSFGGKPESFASERLDPKRFIGYTEVHIEQGPVLEQKDLPMGVVTAIAGQTRMNFAFSGRAGHAGTVPMALRRDALCAAAEFIVAVEQYAKERDEVVATVGQITALPGAGNVIPGEARLSLDVRHAKDSVRKLAGKDLCRCATALANARGLTVKWEITHEAAAVTCDPTLTAIMKRAVAQHQREAPSLPSGAGHDAAALAAIMPVGMLFVRCKGGISHHPDESVREDDVEIAINVVNDFIRLIAEKLKPG
jgi:allantoate deiminase